MPWRLTGTREKSYRIGTDDEAAAWVDDEADFLTHGWILLYRDLQPDGLLRVLYGQLPDEMITQEVRLHQTAPTESLRATSRRPPDAVLRGVAALVTVLGVAFALGLLSHL